MCREAVSRGVRWCQTRRVGYGRSRRACVRSSLSPNAPGQSASPWAQVCRREARVPVHRPWALFLRYGTWFRLPDFGCVFVNGAVARKFSGTGHVQDRLLRPWRRIGIQYAEPFVRLAIGSQVRQVHIVIAEEQECIAQRSEYPRLVAAEVVGENKVESRPGFGLVFIVPARTVPGAAVLDLFHGESEEEHVFLPSLLRHFDGRAIARAARQSSVHHELHVAGSAGFVTGGRNLIGDVARRNQPLCQGNVVLREKNDLDSPAHGRVTVNRARQVVDKFYDQLGQAISWCRFTGEEECARHHLHIGILPQPVLNDDNPQRVQQLPFIFVNALDLAVEYGIGVYNLSRRRLKPIGEPWFGLALRREEDFTKAAVLGTWVEFVEAAQISNRIFANGLRDSNGERGIGFQQPASRCHPVRLVAETLGKHFGQILHRRRPQQLRVDSGYSVRAVRSDNREVGHADLALFALLHEAHTLHPPLVAGEAKTNFVEEPPVDLVDDLEMPGKKYLKPRSGPFLESLRQQRVIGISKGLFRQIPGLVPSQVRIIQQDTHQFRDRHRRMRVVELDRDLLRKLLPIRVVALKAAHQVGQGTRDQEIFLQKSQLLSGGGGVVGIQHTSQ